MFDGKSVLITGGTGSFGRKFVATLLTRHKPRRVIVYSRDELKQFEAEMKEHPQHEAPLPAPEAAPVAEAEAKPEPKAAKEKKPAAKPVEAKANAKKPTAAKPATKKKATTKSK